MASLLDSVLFPAASLADPYHGRGRTEEALRRIKHPIGLEHTSGLTWHAAGQDYGAKAVSGNRDALAAHAATNAHRD
ncbi:hypothetical protein [Accumulibacter sp.]|uniref:hypothetical protein n=1 Tax=Accumulibacter sp. TaxID=2053492 RepID=UPI0026395F3B|nr:hypothetical protein [Accumulibacter sp.]